MRALSGPWPPDKETLNEVLEWQWWQGGHRNAPLFLGAQDPLQAHGKVVYPQAKGLGADLGASESRVAIAKLAIPAPLQNPICL